jgi:hypothetical protein
LDGHKKVVDLNKGNTYGSHLNFWQEISVQEYGTVEYWIRLTDVNQATGYSIMNGQNLGTSDFTQIKIVQINLIFCSIGPMIIITLI